MSGSVEVSHSGLQSARDALQNQADEAQAILSYVESACADNGAFGRGFLALFQGTYASAYNDMTGVLSDGVISAQNRTDAMAATLDDYLSQDELTALSFDSMETTIGPGVPFAEDGTPRLPGEVTLPTKAGNLAQDAENLMDNPMNTAGGIRDGFMDQFNGPGPNTPANPLAPIDLIDQGTKTVGHVDGIADASEDAHNMNDFIDEGDDD